MMNRLASTSKSKTLGPVQHEIRIPVPSYGSTRQLKADRSLIEGPGEDYIKFGAPLYQASITCDWKAAQLILDEYPWLVRYSITGNGETALHVAASVKGSERVEMFVKNLVQRMESTDLEIVNNNSNTALCLAAASGNLETVRILLEKVPRGEQIIMPLCTAALFGNNDVVSYLYEKSNYLRDDGWDSQSRGWLLEKCVEADMFDVALKILKSYPQLGSGSVLGILARKPEAFPEIRKLNIFEKSIHSVFRLIGLKVRAIEKESTAMQLLKFIWEDIAKKPREEIYAILTGSLSLDEQRSFQILFTAAEMGNTKFLVELVRQYPDLMLKRNDQNQTIIHIAIEHRHESIYNLLYEIGAMKDLIIALKDDNGNNMLHLVAKSTKTQLVNLSGAALTMQSELLWFQEVKCMIPLIYREQRNKDGLTPHELFTMEHKDLVKEGERWTKDAINYCVVVAALIATVTFAAAITIPGGFNQDNGIPIFYQKPTFVVFIVADAISLFSSSTSILIFLSIITSRFAEHDFLESLPKKLGLGLSNLFLSVATMMVSFCVSFFIIYHNEMQWIPIFVSVFGSMPVLMYILMQYRLLGDIVRSTYGSRYLFKPKKQSLF